MAKGILRGKTALVTGGAKRIGRAVALALAREGVNIVVHYNTSRPEADDLAAELTSKLGVKAWAVEADFEHEDEIDSLLQRSLDLSGNLEILVNSASIFPTEKLEDVTFESLMRNVKVNAWAPFALSRCFKNLVGRGWIINMIDSRVTGYDWTHVGYIWSKHVLAIATKMIALEYAPDIAVNAVGPGLILPPPGQDESYIERLKGTVPLQKHGDPENIADAVVFLVKSDFITGEVIYVDGGRHLKEYTNG